jgi:4-hydroxyacetophenone monooxygenase
MNKATQRWAVAVRDSYGAYQRLQANIVISAMGIFNPIKMPPIKGLDFFEGPCFHTAEWPADLDLKGKQIAIIGNGASSMQVGPEIQHVVKSLTIFQRSPHWAAPNEQFRKPIPKRSVFCCARCNCTGCGIGFASDGRLATDCTRRCRKTPHGRTLIDR